MEIFASALALLPPDLRRGAAAMPAGEKTACEELRLRRGCPLAANIRGLERRLPTARITGEDLLLTLEKATRASLHSVGDQLCRGYVNAGGGLRLGLCGTAVEERGEVLGMRDFSSLSIRIPREKRGCADEVFSALWKDGLPSALIWSAPGAGKTTLLRELVRRMSEKGICVCVADERGEIAGAGPAGFSFDLGPCADVMTGMPKARAVMSMLRTMNPRAAAVDEITEEADARALRAAAGCGVKLLATAHGGCLEEVLARPAIRSLAKAGAFEVYVGIENRGGQRCYEVRRG